MKLATAEQVQHKLGVQQQFSNNIELYESGLEYATAQLENTLDTALDSVDMMDVWNFEPGVYESADRYKPLQLIASRGFWQESPQVYLSTDGSSITDVTSMTELESTYYATNLEGGTIRLNTRPYPGLHTIAVVYSSGFQDGGSNAPAWLQQAAIAYAIQNIQLHNIGYNKKEMQDKSTEQLRSAYSVVSRHIRTRHGEFPAASTTL